MEMAWNAVRNLGTRLYQKLLAGGAGGMPKSHKVKTRLNAKLPNTIKFLD